MKLVRVRTHISQNLPKDLEDEIMEEVKNIVIIHLNMYSIWMKHLLVSNRVVIEEERKLCVYVPPVLKKKKVTMLHCSR